MYDIKDIERIEAIEGKHVSVWLTTQDDVIICDYVEFDHVNGKIITYNY